MKERTLKRLGQAWFLLIQDHLKLFRLESELAQISILPLVASLLALTIFCISLWCTLLVTLWLCLSQWGLSPILSICGVLVANFFAMGISYHLVIRYKNRMKFEHTRARIKEIFEE